MQQRRSAMVCQTTSRTPQQRDNCQPWLCELFIVTCCALGLPGGCTAFKAYPDSGIATDQGCMFCQQFHVVPCKIFSAVFADDCVLINYLAISQGLPCGFLIVWGLHSEDNSDIAAGQGCMVFSEFFHVAPGSLNAVRPIVEQ